MQPTPQQPAASSEERGEVEGRIRNVRCEFNDVLYLTVDASAYTVSLRAGDYKEVVFLSAPGLALPDPLLPCQHLDGQRARVAYKVVNADNHAGEVLKVEILGR